MDTIIFEDREYPAKTLPIEDFGERLISVESLEDKFFKDDRYVSEEARNVDEMIFFFVPDTLMESGTDEDVISFVEANM